MSGQTDIAFQHRYEGQHGAVTRSQNYPAHNQDHQRHRRTDRLALGAGHATGVMRSLGVSPVSIRLPFDSNCGRHDPPQCGQWQPSLHPGGQGKADPPEPFWLHIVCSTCHLTDSPSSAVLVSGNGDGLDNHLLGQICQHQAISVSGQSASAIIASPIRSDCSSRSRPCSRRARNLSRSSDSVVVTVIMDVDIAAHRNAA